MTHQSDSNHCPRVEFHVHFQTGPRGHKHLRRGVRPKIPELHSEDLPRLTRLLALAHRWNRSIEEGVIADYTEIARIIGLSRARVTQIMDLLYLAPEIQERILCLADEGASRIVLERAIRPITRCLIWKEQCKAWKNTTVETS